MSKLNEMRSHVVAKQGVKEMQSWLDHSILSAYLRRQNCNDEIIRCLQSDWTTLRYTEDINCFLDGWLIYGWLTYTFSQFSSIVFVVSMSSTYSVKTI